MKVAGCKFHIHETSFCCGQNFVFFVQNNQQVFYRTLNKKGGPPVDEVLVGPLGWPIPAHLKAGEIEPKERKWKANKAGILHD